MEQLVTLQCPVERITLTTGTEQRIEQIYIKASVSCIDEITERCCYNRLCVHMM